MTKKLPKIIVVLGPTASGKTDLGIALAKKFNGEVVSADSRQVYKEMDIATAKPAGVKKNGAYLAGGVRHYCIDIVRPDEEFTVAHFKKLATVKINSILRRGKLPIVVGGTGLYLWSIIDNLDIPAVAPDRALRAKLEKMPLPAMVKILKEYSVASYKNIDLKNPRRVLRALELALSGAPAPVPQKNKLAPLYNALQIGIRVPREQLYRRIDARVDQQIAGGLIDEVKMLSEKYDWKLPSMSGIGYKQLGGYLRGEAGLEEAVEMIKRDTRHYAKRQITWFKRDERIKWLDYGKLPAPAHALVKKFLAD
jgi:tRNA dimethylallyltransferase